MYNYGFINCFPEMESILTSYNRENGSVTIGDSEARQEELKKFVSCCNGVTVAKIAFYYKQEIVWGVTTSAIYGIIAIKKEEYKDENQVYWTDDRDGTTIGHKCSSEGDYINYWGTYIVVNSGADEPKEDFTFTLDTNEYEVFNDLETALSIIDNDNWDKPIPPTPAPGRKEHKMNKRNGKSVIIDFREIDDTTMAILFSGGNYQPTFAARETNFTLDCEYILITFSNSDKEYSMILSNGIVDNGIKSFSGYMLPFGENIVVVNVGMAYTDGLWYPTLTITVIS